MRWFAIFKTVGDFVCPSCTTKQTITSSDDWACFASSQFLLQTDLSKQYHVEIYMQHK
jgi:uncharacterized Zn finger protein (UPF0148 family)